MTPSSEQAAVVAAINNPVYPNPNATRPASVIVDSKAGSGKTKTIEFCINKNPKTNRMNTLVLAFNRKIRKELERKLERTSVKVHTFHSYGLKMLCGGFKHSELRTEKIFLAMRKLGEENPSLEQELRGYGESAYGIVDKAKIVGIVPETRANGKPWDQNLKGMMPDTNAAWENLIDTFDLTLPNIDFKMDRLVDISRKILATDIEMTPEAYDYSDMIYAPVISGMESYNAHEHIFIDEAQDLSLLRLELISRQLGPQGRLIAVGDKHQAIYGFAGAHADAFGKVRERFDGVNLTLSVSRRCAKNIIQHAQEIVPEIQALPDAPDGLITDLGGDWDHELFRPHDMVLCRNNDPLVALAYELIENQIPCQILGIDLGKRLAKLIDKMKPTGFTDLIRKLEQRRERQIAKCRTDAERKKLHQRLTQDIRVIDIFIRKNPFDSISGLCERIKNFFSNEEQVGETIDPTKVVLLSTIHKAKGLEAPRVFILDSELIGGGGRPMQEWEAQQEENLRYVAITRAQRELVYIDNES